MWYVICRDCRTRHKTTSGLKNKIFTCPVCGSKIKSQPAKTSKNADTNLKKGPAPRSDIADEVKSLSVFSCFDCNYVWKRHATTKVEMDFCPKCDRPTAAIGYDNDVFIRAKQRVDSEADYRDRRHAESRDSGQKITIGILTLMFFFLFLNILFD